MPECPLDEQQKKLFWARAAGRGCKSGLLASDVTIYTIISVLE